MYKQVFCNFCRQATSTSCTNTQCVLPSPQEKIIKMTQKENMLVVGSVCTQWHFLLPEHRHYQILQHPLTQLFRHTLYIVHANTLKPRCCWSLNFWGKSQQQKPLLKFLYKTCFCQAHPPPVFLHTPSASPVLSTLSLQPCSTSYRSYQTDLRAWLSCNYIKF